MNYRKHLRRFSMLLVLSVLANYAPEVASAQTGSYHCGGSCKVYVYSHNSPNWCENMTKNQACAINAEIPGCENNATHQGSDQDVGDCTWNGMDWWETECFECHPYEDW